MSAYKSFIRWKRSNSLSYKGSAITIRSSALSSRTSSQK